MDKRTKALITQRGTNKGNCETTTVEYAKNAHMVFPYNYLHKKEAEICNGKKKLHHQFT